MKTESVGQKLAGKIKHFFLENGKKKAVLGLSGGVDSALVCSLLVKALGQKNVTALLMPCKGVSSRQNVLDAKNFAKSQGINTIVQEINLFFKAFTKIKWKQSKTAKANLMPRIRAILLYNYANSNNCLVAGTGNRTELELGYFTKYGDGAADFFPIGRLRKMQVLELAKQLGIPKKIVNKTPTAELWKGQSDEKEIGLSYKEMDALLSGLLDKGKTTKELEQEGFSKQNIQKIIKRIKKNQHKQNTPPSINI